MGRRTRSEIELGYVSGVFGVRGEVRLFLHNPDSYLLSGSHSVVLQSPSGERRPARLSARPGAGKRILGRIEGVTDRDQAAALGKWRVLVARDALPELSEDEYYLWQLEGAQVRMGGESVGRVAAIHSTGPVELIEILRPDGERVFVPSLRAFVANVDAESGVVELTEDALEE